MLLKIYIFKPLNLNRLSIILSIHLKRLNRTSGGLFLVTCLLHLKVGLSHIFLWHQHCTYLVAQTLDMLKRSITNENFKLELSKYSISEYFIKCLSFVEFEVVSITSDGLLRDIDLSVSRITASQSKHPPWCLRMPYTHRYYRVYS